MLLLFLGVDKDMIKEENNKFVSVISEHTYYNGTTTNS